MNEETVLPPSTVGKAAREIKHGEEATSKYHPEIHDKSTMGCVLSCIRQTQSKHGTSHRRDGLWTARLSVVIVTAM